MSKYKYNSYPLGKVSFEKQRPELYKLKDHGYEFDDAREVIDIFENKVASFAGCKYAVAVDCCSHGLFLSLEYLLRIKELDYYTIISIPKRTYISVPMQINNVLLYVDYRNIKWSGIYQLNPTRVWDSAARWTKGMYVGDNALQVVSFQYKKIIPIGKGGMILTDDAEAAKMLKLMSYDGRDLTVPYDAPDHIKTLGFHMYMTPEDAARGILLMDATPEVNKDYAGSQDYPDIEKMMQ